MSSKPPFLLTIAVLGPFRRFRYLVGTLDGWCFVFVFRVGRMCLRPRCLLVPLKLPINEGGMPPF